MWHMVNILKEFPDKLTGILMISFPFLMASLFLFLLKDKLPKDGGRDFAFNGKKSAGKPRGAGIIIITVFILASLLFIPIKPENIIYYLLIFSGMLSGFLDDKSKKPWGEYKKGTIDLVISFIAAFTFTNFNPGQTAVRFFNYECRISNILFIGITTVLIWISINATNCSDGIDGFCGTLSIISIAFIGISGLIVEMDSDILRMIILMIFSIMPYLWLNSEPSRMMMGDAGSRAIGLFIGIAVLKTGNILFYLPFCFVLLCDGLLGIIKVFFLRFLKINLLKNIRTPLHDHFRKNKNWSNAQTIMRFAITQIVISVLTIILIK